jgi:protein-S-isoprenylcysteine O-methyltransferase Ste14
MTDIEDVERAEKLGNRRARLFAVQALLFVTWQGGFFVSEERLRLVDTIRISAWLVWVVALLALLATGGGLLRSRSVRALLNDELTRANRAKAYTAGFWAAAVSSIGLYVIAMVDEMGPGEAIHGILSAAIAAAMITFAALERRNSGFG